MLKILARQAGQKDQDSAFVSRVMAADEQSSNARPGMEIYFKAPVNVERMKPVMDFLSANGIHGFTMIAYPSMNRKPGEFLGMRFRIHPQIYGGPESGRAAKAPAMGRAGWPRFRTS